MRVLLAIFVLYTVALGFQGAVNRRGVGIAEGQPAADFTLKLLKSEKTFKLSSNFGKQPTVLIFGSYT